MDIFSKLKLLHKYVKFVTSLDYYFRMMIRWADPSVETWTLICLHACEFHFTPSFMQTFISITIHMNTAICKNCSWIVTLSQEFAPQKENQGSNPPAG